MMDLLFAGSVALFLHPQILMDWITLMGVGIFTFEKKKFVVVVDDGQGFACCFSDFRSAWCSMYYDKEY